MDFQKFSMDIHVLIHTSLAHPSRHPSQFPGRQAPPGAAESTSISDAGGVAA